VVAILVVSREKDHSVTCFMEHWVKKWRLAFPFDIDTQESTPMQASARSWGMHYWSA
jgi:hypothetical protein